MPLVRCLHRILILLVTAAVLQVVAVAREVEGTVPLVRGVRHRVYGALRDSVLVVSNGQEERTLPLDRYGRFHAELHEGTWKVIDVAPEDRKHVQTGQTFEVPSGERILRIMVPMQLR